MTLAPAERLARLRLARTEGVGAVGFHRLLARFGSGERAVAALPDLWRREGRELAPQALAEDELAAADRLGARHVFAGEAAFPPRLAALADPPPVLLVKGDAALAARPTAGIVGARNASAAGRRLAEAMARELGQAGFVTVSGLARGIDAAAHRGALATGTIACVAGGLDVAYPPENAALQEEIGALGLLVSEMPPGTEPQARHFPRRNRLIAGLAEGLVVIEAALGSGSLITARLAGEAGREVMAVPGHPLDPRARGGNALLKAGATLVEDAADVIAALRPFALAGARAPEAPPAPAAAPEARDAPEAPADSRPADAAERLAALLSPVPVPIDLLVRESGLPAAQVTALLTDMELAGTVVRHSGGRVASA
ncbi:DNA-processing protein DprA [Thermaurantiacus tibetensis]|uniref:DNA-processing protein DprA n=1 Tax=Thermaurantiacus tibetensis TaxID=2759035 RepID=UPI00188E39A2|nr:DNA-processing protein DprA [Thermaurantiacus tibetensis]